MQHALKAAGQWKFITGAANEEAEDYESKKYRRLSTQYCSYWAEIHANGYEVSNPKRYVGHTMPILRKKESEKQGLYTDAAVWTIRMKIGT